MTDRDTTNILTNNYSVKSSLCEKCPNTELFLVRISLYSCAVKYRPEITLYLDTFHAMIPAYFFHNIR